MNRRLSADEIRDFFAISNNQFEQSGFILHSVRFIRDLEGNLSEITLNYTQDDNFINSQPKTATSRSI